MGNRKVIVGELMEGGFNQNIEACRNSQKIKKILKQNWEKKTNYKYVLLSMSSLEIKLSMELELRI